MKCDNCNCEESYIKEHIHNFKRGNIEYSFKSNRRFCSKCNNLVYDAKLDNEASEKAILTYTSIVGVSPEDIINLRKKYNLSQSQFSKIIGCAKKTLISYEQGRSIPNDIYLVTLKMLLDNPDILINLIESNKDRYTLDEYNIINNKLSNYYINNKVDEEPTEYNGFTDLSYAKIENLVLILSSDNILKTKLLKEMFYIDFISYKERGCSITGLEYIKYQYGPVPNDFEKILNDLANNKCIKYEVSYNDNGYESHNISAIKEKDDVIFNQKELDIIMRVKYFFKDYNTKKIVDFSHEEKAFKDTEMFNLIDYSYAFYIDRI